jgi:hypothetical protein
MCFSIALDSRRKFFWAEVYKDLRAHRDFSSKHRQRQKTNTDYTDTHGSTRISSKAARRHLNRAAPDALAARKHFSCDGSSEMTREEWCSKPNPSVSIRVYPYNPCSSFAFALFSAALLDSENLA